MLFRSTSGQARFPVAPSIFKFQQHGKSGAWLSELMPQLGSIADDLAILAMTVLAYEDGTDTGFSTMEAAPPR